MTSDLLRNDPFWTKSTCALLMIIVNGTAEECRRAVRIIEARYAA